MKCQNKDKKLEITGKFSYLSIGKYQGTFGLRIKLFLLRNFQNSCYRFLRFVPKIYRVKNK